MSERGTVAITGGTGFVGRAVIDRALDAGYRARALTRRRQNEREGVAWVPGDLGDAAALARLVDGAQQVIHVAGLVSAPDATAFDLANVAGTRAVLDAAIAGGAARFVFVSSLSAREPRLSAYGASKAKAEAVVRGSSIDWVIVRPPAVYGPHDRDMFELFRAARWGIAPVPSTGRASVIHVHDLARLLVALARAPDVAGRRFEPDDGALAGWDHRDLARAIGDAVGGAVGRRMRVLPVLPRWMARAARLDRLLRGSAAKLTADRVGYLTHPDWVVDTASRVPAAIWQPMIETRAGLAATAAWYRAAGWL